MTIVYNTLKDPAGNPVVAEVEVRLVANITNIDNGGYVFDDKYEVLGTWSLVGDGDGYWEVDLEPNGDLVPAGTYYEVIQRYNPGRRTSRTLIEVPVSGGPYWIGDILISAPADIGRFIRAAQVTVVPTAGIVSTNVQDALVELKQAITEGAGDAHYFYDQSSPAATWTIVHNLGKYPAVSVTSSAGEQVEGHVVYVDDTTVQVSFSGAFSGSAFLN